MNSSNLKFAILTNEDNDHLLWIKAIEDLIPSASYMVIDLTSNLWLEKILSQHFDYFLTKPPGLSEKHKQLYDERLYIITNELGFKVYPSYKEVIIYENKRFLSEWLKANKIPHPNTFVFYSISEAEDFLKTSKFPIVAKLNIGASGNGVFIQNNFSEATSYLNKIFSKNGITSRTIPKSIFKNINKRLNLLFTNPGHFKNRIDIYRKVQSNPQKGYVIFQEYIEHSFEWRVVRIGDSFYAHKKLVKNKKASGTLLKEYCNPPLSLLDFVKEITDKHRMYSMCIDIFENGSKNYLVNEMQCIFGQSDPYQMLVDGVPGKYVYNNGWEFISGDFNKNESYNNRIEFVLSNLLKNQNN